jgi:hypothetical protein
MSFVLQCASFCGKRAPPRSDKEQIVAIHSLECEPLGPTSLLLCFLIRLAHAY